MSEAREVMDRMTDALTTTRDLKSVVACYAGNAVLVTPDQGEITGRDGIAEYFRQFLDAIPDVRWESVYKHDAGEVAVDEGFATGTNTGPLSMPSGEPLPATGKQIRLRGCDIATVEGGLIARHHFYFDQMELLGQLGLLPETFT
jgi:predicted ester cyclase